MENDWKRCLCESKKEKNAFITWLSSSYTKILLIVNNAKQQKGLGKSLETSWNSKIFQKGTNVNNLIIDP